MPSGHGERYDFFLSRRGSVADIAQEVADVLTEKSCAAANAIRLNHGLGADGFSGSLSRSRALS
jgi:hypothetical protein